MHPAIAEKHISITNLCRRNGSSRLESSVLPHVAWISMRRRLLPNLEAEVRGDCSGRSIEIDDRIPIRSSARSDPCSSAVSPPQLFADYSTILSVSIP